jgi:peroxiredoxin
VFSTTQAAPKLEGGDFQFFQNPPPANDFSMSPLTGGTINLSDFKGKVVLLNFWRKDCKYCDMEKGFLRQVAQGLNTQDLKVVCVNLWDQPAWVRSFGQNSGSGLMIMSKPEGKRAVVENTVRGKLMGYYVVNEANEAIYEVKGFPCTYVIDKQGRVVATHLGLAQWTNPTVKSWLASLLGPKTAEPVEVETRRAVARVEDPVPEWLHGILSGPAMKNR